MTTYQHVALYTHRCVLIHTTMYNPTSYHQCCKHKVQLLETPIGTRCHITNDRCTHTNHLVRDTERVLKTCNPTNRSAPRQQPPRTCSTNTLYANSGSAATRSSQPFISPDLGFLWLPASPSSPPPPYPLVPPPPMSPPPPGAGTDAARAECNRGLFCL